MDEEPGLGRKLPCLVNLMPSGEYLMEDFYYAGGLPVVLRELGKAGLLHKNALTVSGDTIWNNVKAAKNRNPKVVFPIEKPFKKQGGIAVLRGNLVPKGAVIKPSAATPKLMKHRGRAVVFESIEDYRKRIDDPKLKIDETCVIVLKGCGPKGYPGFPEVGNFALPARILKKGITDMVRISDARMSGTAYGTVVLHSAPEAAAGGPRLRQALYRPREPGRRRRRPGYSGRWQRDAVVAGIALAGRREESPDAALRQGMGNANTAPAGYRSPERRLPQTGRTSIKWQPEPTRRGLITPSPASAHRGDYKCCKPPI